MKELNLGEKRESLERKPNDGFTRSCRRKTNVQTKISHWIP